MFALSLQEAQLLRILAGLFGKDAVVPQMRVIAVCGGQIPDCGHLAEAQEWKPEELQAWAKNHRCLFTIVDPEDNPRLVVDLFSTTSDAIVARDMEHKKYLGPLLGVIGIPYVAIQPDELAEMLDPEGTLDIYSFFQAKVEQGGDE